MKTNMPDGYLKEYKNGNKPTKKGWYCFWGWVTFNGTERKWMRYQAYFNGMSKEQYPKSDFDTLEFETVYYEDPNIFNGVESTKKTC